MRLYNTLSKQVEPVNPIDSGKISLFVCGITVYDMAHIGHAKTYTQFDLLARVMRQSGLQVTYLQNITDIDDKIIQRAHEQNITWSDLAQKYEAAYLEDMSSLNNTGVDIYARASDYIPDIISQVSRLLDMGFAYILDDGIYFEVAKFDQYGKLSGRQDIRENDAQTRIDQNAQKHGWNDFCLWKFAEKGEPSWPAPFGEGRPGWHIEDTAITEHFFGVQYDIHGGAVDLIFPHHEAEITQMESLSGQIPLVRHWVHAGFLTIGESKMSKSRGNFITIREILDQTTKPMALRLLMLQSHYRSEISFNPSLLTAAAARLSNYQAWADLRYQTKDLNQSTPDLALIQTEIQTELENDLATPKALAKLDALIDQQNKLLLVSQSQDFTTLLKYLDEVFGLGLLTSSDISPETMALIQQREAARNDKDYALADKLRAKLLDQGIEIDDTSHGPIWRRGI